MKTWGVACFVIGVGALALLAIRRGQESPPRATDHLMMFVGIAGIIAGLALFLVYSMKV